MKEKNYNKLEDDYYFNMIIFEDNDKAYKNMLNSKYYECMQYINQLDYISPEDRKFVMFMLCNSKEKLFR